MEKLQEILKIHEDRNRLFFSLFCLLISSMLFYFWVISKGKKGAKVKHGGGLIFISYAYALYFFIGFVSLFFIDYSSPPAKVYFVLSGLISMCFLLSLPFFSLSSHSIDRIVENPYWTNVINTLGFVWLIFLASMDYGAWMDHADMVVSVLVMAIMGFFIARYLARRGLKLLGGVAVIFFLVVIILQIYPSAEGKFENMNTYMIGPALTLSVVMLSFTFNWINELSFYELADIWVGDEKESKEKLEEFYKLTIDDNKKTWMGKIAKDDIEKVIEEIIILKKHKNEDLEMIVNIASRNSRNNNDRLKDIISYEDYQLSRNKISNALVAMISRKKK